MKHIFKKDVFNLVQPVMPVCNCSKCKKVIYDNQN